MLKYISIFFAAFLSLSVNIVLGADGIKNVAITQIVSHDALNKVRDGITARLKQQYGNRVNIELFNANGNIVVASQIADKIVSSKPDLIIAIATSSAQTVLKAAKGTNIPILFATVTDPVGAQLVANLKKPGANISGTRNISPLREQLLIAKEAMPNLKKLGVILSMSETNSVFMLKNLKMIAKELSIEIQEKSVTNSGEVKFASESLAEKIDAFFLLQDNIVVSGIPALIKTANKANKPVISSYIEAVSLGALIGLAYNEYSIGQQTGNMAIRVLEGESPGNMAVEDPDKIELAVNHKAAATLGIKLPKVITSKADSNFN